MIEIFAKDDQGLSCWILRALSSGGMETDKNIKEY